MIYFEDKVEKLDEMTQGNSSYEKMVDKGNML